MNWNSLFTYHPAGYLVNKRTGKKAGTVRPDGYTVINLNATFHLAHRIVWQMHNGSIPVNHQVDHINHNRSDNLISNLRLVSNAENAKNRRITDKNKSGTVGVNWDVRRQKWRSTIMVNYKCTHLGYFESLVDAVNARREAETFYGFHKNHGK